VKKISCCLTVAVLVSVATIISSPTVSASSLTVGEGWHDFCVGLAGSTAVPLTCVDPAPTFTILTSAPWTSAPDLPSILGPLSTCGPGGFSSNPNCALDPKDPPHFYGIDPAAPNVPEPNTLLLIGAGLLSLFGLAGKRYTG
jgi:hypothetical protein